MTLRGKRGQNPRQSYKLILLNRVGLMKKTNPVFRMGSMDTSFSKLQGLVMNREAWRAEIHEVAKSRTRLSY